MGRFIDQHRDIEALRQMSGTITMAAGRTSLAHRRFYAETAPVLAERIGCAMAVFPGHHASFADRPDEWAAELRKTLHRWR